MLYQIGLGDYVVIGTRDGTFIYEVNRLRIVNKNDRTVIVPTDSATLTLSTCYPFRYFGNAPKRYIVSATLLPPEYVELDL
jgi:sortase A